MKKIMFLLLVGIMFIPKVFASECSNTELLRLRKLANLITFDVKYIGDVSDDEFGIQLSRVHTDLVIVYDNNSYFGDVLLNKLLPKKTYVISVYTQATNPCWNDFNYIRRITIPAYNFFHDSEICKQHKDISYCSLNYDSNGLSEETFTNKVNEYLNSLNEEPITVTTKKINYYLVGGVSALIIVLIICIFMFIRIRKKRMKFN